MFALFVLLQVAFAAKDFIFEDSDGEFARWENGECVYVSNGKSRKATFSSGSDFKSYSYDNDDCSGDGKSESSDMSKYLMDCPKYVGFEMEETGDECKYQSYALRTYYKEGCQKSVVGSVKYVEEDNKLKSKAYLTSADCSGNAVDTEIGQCNTCYTDTKRFVQCGTVANFVIALLALIFFLF